MLGWAAISLLGQLRIRTNARLLALLVLANLGVGRLHHDGGVTVRS
jgi:hypothetical protein